MLNVFVAYDLMHPGQNYGAVEAAVSGLGSAVKLLNTTWYVRTGLSLDQVRAHVSAAMDLNDRLLVTYTRSVKAKYLKVFPEISADTVTWTSGDEQFELLETEAIGDLERVTYRSTATVSPQPAGFIRLRFDRH